MRSTIKTFSDLVAWQKAHELTLLVYKHTNNLPDDEKYRLTDQTRRAVVSVESNIAEGFGRETTKDKIRFYSLAHGSLSELQTQLLIIKDLDYIKEADFKHIYSLSLVVGQLIGGLKRHLRNRI